MQVLKIIVICLEVVMLFNLLILVHELGHYLAARWRGLVIDRFGIWFGKPIWKKKINGVDFCLGCIPAGGYVALPQMAPMEAIEGKTEAAREPLPPVSALDKIIVAFAGPLFSFSLALVFAVVVWAIGRPVGEADATTLIGYVKRGSPAEKAGLRPGDRILKVDGHPVTRFSGIGDTIMWRVVSSQGAKIPIEVERDGTVLTVESEWVKEETKSWERKSLRQIQIAPKKTPLVGKVEPNSPAARAGIRPNDVIVEVDGIKLLNPETLGEYIEQQGAGKELKLKVLRNDRTLEFSLKPEMPIYPPDFPAEERRALIGVVWERTGKWTVDHPGPIEQIYSSVNSMVSTFGALFSPKSDVKAQHLSGPVGIMRIYYLLFESEHGWRQAIWFSVILNVNLALLNLLPIPVLDGGHITLALVEAIRRKPVGVRFLLIVQNACAVLIIGYMLYVTFYDVQDLPWKRDKKFEIKFAPKTDPAPAPAK
jgi:regulator of sigma E protease